MPKANMNRKLTEQEKNEIIKMYGDGMLPNEIGRKLRVYYKYVIEVLQDNGLHSYVNSITTDLESEIIKMYTVDNISITDISDMCLIKRDKIRHFIGKNNCYKGDERRFSDDDIEWLKVHYPSDSWETILQHFPNKNRQSIHYITSANNIRRIVNEWTDDEVATLKKCWSDNLSINEISKMFPNHTTESIETKACKLGITKSRVYTKEEDDILNKYYGKIPFKELCEMLPKRTKNGIWHRIKKLGLRSSIFWSESEDRFLKDHWQLMPDIVIGTHIDRSRQSVKERRHYLGLFRQDLNNKTYPTLSKYIRGQIWEWKQKSMESCDWKCLITGSKDFEIHHLYGVSNILSDIISKYNIKEKQIKDYTQEELDNIAQLFIEEQAKYPLGVCVRKDIHILFHRLYGQYYNTPEQWYQFVEDYKNGIYDELLEDKIA